MLISDVVPWRLQLAEQLGGLPVNLKEQSLDEGLRYHGLKEVDVAFDTSGKGCSSPGQPANSGQAWALVCIGHGEDLNLTVSPDLIATERAVLGSEYFRFDELPANLERMSAHGDYLRQIITHRFWCQRNSARLSSYFSQGKQARWSSNNEYRSHQDRFDRCRRLGLCSMPVFLRLDLTLIFALLLGEPKRKNAPASGAVWYTLLSGYSGDAR